MVGNILKAILFSLSAAIFVSGCQVVPGSEVSVSQKQVLNPLTHEEEQELRQNISVYRITPDLLRGMMQDKLQQEKTLDLLRTKLSSSTEGYQYVISPGDVLKISLWGQPEIQGVNQNGGPISVNEDGRIYFPYAGSVRVAGKTIAQARNMLTTRLSNYIRNPQLDVAVASYKSKKVYVTGEVAQPGVQAITNTPLTILDAINTAGGLTEHAVWNEVVLNRNGHKYFIPMRKLLQQGDLDYNYLMKNGDILHIPRDDKYQVIVMGEVIKPQNMRLGRYGTTLTEALGRVGGINELRADATGVFVIRSSKNSDVDSFVDPHIADVYQLNMSDATALALGNKFELHPGDVIYVTAVPIARWNRVLSNLIPSVNGLNSINSLVN